jgi:hypothetical protein
MKLRLPSVIILASLLSSCQWATAPPAKELELSGTVRNVWCHGKNGDWCDITVEQEGQGMYLLRVADPAPVWAGLHCQIKYHYLDSGPYVSIDSVKRLT